MLTRLCPWLQTPKKVHSRLSQFLSFSVSLQLLWSPMTLLLSARDQFYFLKTTYIPLHVFPSFITATKVTLKNLHAFESLWLLLDFKFCLGIWVYEIVLVVDKKDLNNFNDTYEYVPSIRVKSTNPCVSAGIAWFYFSLLADILSFILILNYIGVYFALISEIYWWN